MAEAENTTSTKVPAVIRSGGMVQAFVPTDLDQIWRMARMAVVGKMAPKSLVDGKDPDEATSACAIAIMAGAELGLTPLMSLRSYAVINGRPSLWGDGIKAVVRKSGICEYIRTGHNEKGGWCEAKRKDNGEEKREDFTFEQAKKAKLMDKPGPWRDGYADVMAERRATFRCLNDLFADVLGGLANGEEAIEDGPIDVTPASRPAPPTPPEPPEPPEPKGKIIEPDPAQPDQKGGGDEPGAKADAAADFVPEGEITPEVQRSLDQIKASLAACNSEEGVESTFDGFDVQADFAGNTLAIGKAFGLKDARLAEIANDGQGALFGDDERSP